MLFKESLNIDLAEIKQYLSVSQNGSFSKMRPHIAAAEILYIKDLLGETLFNRLNDYYNSEESGSTSASASGPPTKPPILGGTEYSGSTSGSIETEASLAALLPLVQNALINFAYYVGADEIGLHITDAGIQIITDETHKQAFQWQVEAAKSSWLNKAYLFSDVVLLFLEQHLEHFPSWRSSDAFTENMDSLLYTTGQFNDEFFIRNSRRLFLALKPVIRSIESKYAVPTLSQAYYNTLLTSMRSGTISADDQVILKKIRTAIAHLSMAEAITRFSVEIFPEGVYSNLVSAFGTILAKNPSNKFDKANAISSLTADGNAEIQAVQTYLDANASQVKYPLYFVSSRYKSPVTSPNRSEFKNDAAKGICLL
jgi:hypothetical protein